MRSRTGLPRECRTLYRPEGPLQRTAVVAEAEPAAMVTTTAAITSASNPRHAARRFRWWIGTVTATPLARKRWAADLNMKTAWLPSHLCFLLGRVMNPHDATSDDDRVHGHMARR